MESKRVVVLADLHCSHRVGLTPPLWQNQTSNPKWNRIQKVLYSEYLRMVDTYTPCDILLLLGDNIDGKGTKSGGTEQISTDRYEQAKIAAHAINEWNAGSAVGVYGTSYHTGITEDWEDVVFDKLNCSTKKIGGQEWVDINGCVLI